MGTDFTRPGSTSQQDDLRDIQERLARDCRRVKIIERIVSKFEYRENQHKESTTQSRDRDTTAGRITTDIPAKTTTARSRKRKTKQQGKGPGIQPG